MSSIQNNIINYPSNSMSGELMEKVITCNDLSGLSAIEKVMYVKSVCESLGLNPLTKPFQLLKFNGKEMMYATKDATEQLRKIHNVSIDNLETKIIDGIYIVTSFASLPCGKKDSSTGVISISGLKGDALANAMMKAETKSKRRVTLSICGLGVLDESEIDTMRNANKIDIYPSNTKINNEPVMIENKRLEPSKEDIEFHFNEFMSDIELCETIDDLKNIFINIKNIDFKNDIESFKKLVVAKDNKKSELLNTNFDNETGEITN
jgi:hypothetical protein